MKTKNLFGISLLFLAVLSIVSCSKDDDNDAPVDKKLLPSKIILIADNGTPADLNRASFSIEYDSQNRISTLRTEYSYHAGYLQGTIVEKFSYDGDNMTIEATRSGASEYNATSNFIRQGSEIIVNSTAVDSKEYRIGIDSNLRSKDYTYDSKGNVTNYAGLLEYDDSNGVFHYVNMPSWYLTNVFSIGIRNLHNNCVKAIHDGGTGQGFTNTYNTDNYPTNITDYYINVSGVLTTSYDIEYIEVK